MMKGADRDSCRRPKRHEGAHRVALMLLAANTVGANPALGVKLRQVIDRRHAS
jgi:hypothetical protein